MVKAVVVREYGGPEVMKIEDVEVGKPGPGQVKVRNRAVGLNFIDTYFRSGLYKAPTLPFIAGNEAAGEITEIGKGVRGFKVGDRVGYVSSLGSYAQERLIEARILVKLPKKISYETAAGMMLKGLTAQYLLRQTFRVKRGHVILVHAAAGGVGLLLCQWGKALGATVIGTVGSKEKGALAKKAGAKHIIYYKQENFVDRVREITKGKLCDVVYDGVGKDTFPASLDCLKKRGMFASFGSASGPIEAFNIGLLVQKGSLFATRPTLYDYADTPVRLAAMARDLFSVVARGKVKIPVNKRYKMQDVVEAHKALQGRKTTGSTILIP
ncbi:MULTISPECIES: quinone oxidoreductase [unclassified Beijerinckia]|uniref:quinone oxidoreductase family protein n=1 Tax=unclassified Beijerinckia TaxID=2638183 RepID=UPI0008992866|nr:MULTISPECIES: quinone oxidoreductase [unclassified Beijerinckia]MDH7795501.1 NADPH2:quinone reductase [Beijerinckia sp. GAS462]SEC04200.1 NADPH2:quinone reductase [Beijerinckia sp. 28-YEA-48]